MTDPTSRQPNMCDCERGHNGLGVMGRECDCTAGAAQSADSETPALLPCPFCGSNPSLVQALPSGWAVSCAGCGVGSGIRYSLMEDARPLVAEQWNRRADLARPSQAGDERVAERIVIALWREEAAPGTPSVQKLRNADTWVDQAPELRDRWMRFARAALAAMDTPKGGGE